jgi:hypothetical protein
LNFGKRSENLIFKTKREIAPIVKIQIDVKRCEKVTAAAVRFLSTPKAKEKIKAHIN